ncbi:hypothetical protein HH310_35970 [Actinoplanes sp. TBRC 11911]|uniref:hypothetical protein n=1 Tax=Actinoplanes sp. TBRC 11911 TaxID=2729386 RepID=UPI00145CD1EB|nr:hypothetical protein [Actinoplanes sp. TBRC 11911]NMO56561.1 hypothetical protein [Actinoplanes sp. TBRC 11911]
MTGAYYPVAPARVLDTRSGLGAPKAALGAGKFIDLQATGRGGVPTVGVSAVVLNVTVTSGTASSFLTVYPTGAAKPTTSSINFPKGWTGANSVTTGVGTGGKVRIYNGNGATQVIADVVGFYAADSTVLPQAGPNDSDFYPITPTRWIDTRDGGEGARLGDGDYYQLGFIFDPSVNPYVRAVALNITAVSPTGTGYLSTWNGDESESSFPTTSTLNYTSGHNVPNMAIVPTSPCTAAETWCADENGNLGVKIGVINAVAGGKSTHLIVDLVGAYDNSAPGQGLRFKPITPQRITDTRSGLGYPTALGKGVTGNVTVPDSLTQAYALSTNVTAVTPTANTFLTLWPSGFDRPTASNLNPTPGQIVSNAAVVGLGADNAFNIYNLDGSTNVVVDVNGTFQPLATVGAQAKAKAQARSTSGKGSRSGTAVNGPHRTR